MISFKTILIVEIHLSIGYSFERADKFREFRGFRRLTSVNFLFVFLCDFCANFVKHRGSVNVEIISGFEVSEKFLL